MRLSRLSWRPALALLIPLLALGCRDEGIRHYRVNKTAAAFSAEEAPPAAAPLPHATGLGTLQWTLPEGWSEAAGSGIRFATLKAPGDGDLDISVVVLGGAAGGETANINRWRAQMALSPLDEAAVAKARGAVRSNAGSVSLFDFTTESGLSRSMVVGFLRAPDGNTWFLKMAGDPTAVAKARSQFVKLLESLRLG